MQYSIYVKDNGGRAQIVETDATDITLMFPSNPLDRVIIPLIIKNK